VEGGEQQRGLIAQVDCCYNRSLIGEIIPGLWIGGIFALNEIAKIAAGATSSSTDPRSRQKWTIVSLLSPHSRLNKVVEEQLEFLRQPRGEEGRQQQLGGVVHIVKHAYWELDDKPHADLISPRLEEILQIIDEALASGPASDTARPDNNDDGKGNCLVHCAFGVSRSVAACAAYLMSRPSALRRNGRNGDESNGVGSLTLQQALDTIRRCRDVNPNLGFLAGLRALEQCGGDVERARQRLRFRERGA